MAIRFFAVALASMGLAGSVEAQCPCPCPAPRPVCCAPVQTCNPCAVTRSCNTCATPACNTCATTSVRSNRFVGARRNVATACCPTNMVGTTVTAVAMAQPMTMPMSGVVQAQATTTPKPMTGTVTPVQGAPVTVAANGCCGSTVAATSDCCCQTKARRFGSRRCCR